MLASSVVKRGFKSRWVKPKIMKLVFVNTNWLGIGTMCPSGATCPPMDCCLSELAQCKSTKHVGLVQSVRHHLVGM